MTCRDCIHFKACAAMLADQGYDIDEEFGGSADRCDTFEEKIDLERIKAQAKAEGIKEFAERLKRYYNTLKGESPAPLVAYHIDQIKNELIGGSK